MPLTYSALQSFAARTINRNDDEFLADLPNLIMLAEERINHGDAATPGLRCADMETMASLTPDADGFASLPADYLQMRAIDSPSSGNKPFSRDFYDVSGRGFFGFSYMVTGNRVRFTRGAVGAQPFYYYARIPALSTSNPTNWLLTKAPSIYLYGTLLAAAPYESDDARIQTWLALYSSAMTGLRSTDIGARYSNSVARVRRATP